MGLMEVCVCVCVCVLGGIRIHVLYAHLTTHGSADLYCWKMVHTTRLDCFIMIIKKDELFIFGVLAQQQLLSLELLAQGKKSQREMK